VESFSSGISVSSDMETDCRRLTPSDSAGARAPNMTSAMVRLDPEEFVNIRKIEFRASQRSHAIVGQLRLVDSAPKLRDTTGMATLFGFILEDTAPPTCSKFDEGPICSSIPVAVSVVDNIPADTGSSDRHSATAITGMNGSRARVVPPTISLLDALDDGDVVRPADVSMGRAPSISNALAGSSTHSLSRTASTSGATLVAEAAARRIARAEAGNGRSLSATADFALPSRAVRQAPRLSSHIPALSPMIDPEALVTTLAPSPAFQPPDAIVFPADTYEIILILDTREVESQSNRDKISESLERKGVRVETRALRLGDMCWVARRRDGLGGEEDECVLDYVVERKRLDDLCSSIKDGRYNEQCVSRVSKWDDCSGATDMNSSDCRARASPTSTISSKIGRWRNGWCTTVSPS
jgi:crossover junction endonuclease MUS81